MMHSKPHQQHTFHQLQSNDGISFSLVCVCNESYPKCDEFFHAVPFDYDRSQEQLGVMRHDTLFFLSFLPGESICLIHALVFYYVF